MPLNKIIAQEPAAGDDIVKGESVNITVSRRAQPGTVPPVNGRTLAAAAALNAAHFGTARSRQRRQRLGRDPPGPTPGTTRALGTQVTLAVENRAATAGGAALAAGVGGAAGLAGTVGLAATTGAAGTTGTAGATGTSGAAGTTGIAGAADTSGAAGAAGTTAPTSAGAAPSGIRGRRADHSRRGRGRRHCVRRRHPDALPTARVSTATAKLPASLVFAGAAGGQLYRLTGDDKRAARLTSAKHFLETPTADR